MKVNVVCRNLDADRILPRFARYLRDGLGWSLTPAPVGTADVLYLLGYFETQVSPGWEQRTVASLFTHREEQPPGSPKAKLFDAVARRVDLRVTMNRLYGRSLEACGPTIQPPLPVERSRFVPAPHPRRRRPVVGLAGFAYKNHRKGESWIRHVVRATPDVDWIASGRGWPVTAKVYPWAEMPQFYQHLDVLVCPSLVEGGPMPPLEALACGVTVVVPTGVGILDELPAHPGIVRYPRGDAAGLVRALKLATTQPTVNSEALRAVTEPFTVEAWCRAHAEGFAQRFAQGAAA